MVLAAYVLAFALFMLIGFILAHFGPVAIRPYCILTMLVMASILARLPMMQDWSAYAITVLLIFVGEMFAIGLGIWVSDWLAQDAADFEQTQFDGGIEAS